MSRHTVRRLAAASVAACSLVALTACSSGSSGGSDGPTTIALWTHNGGNDAELAANQQIVDDFNASQSDYRVELEAFPQASYNDAVVAAASVLAKSHRDLQMAALAGQFPQYGWERNAGYAGAAEHVDGVAAHGLSVHHRRSWRIPAQPAGA